MFVTVVFRLEDEFRDATMLAVVDTVGYMKTEDELPIPLSVVRKLRRLRYPPLNIHATHSH